MSPLPIDMIEELAWNLDPSATLVLSFPFSPLLLDVGLQPYLQRPVHLRLAAPVARAGKSAAPSVVLPAPCKVLALAREPPRVQALPFVRTADNCQQWDKRHRVRTSVAGRDPAPKSLRGKDICLACLR